MGIIGEAFIKVAADTGGFRSELQRDVEAAASSVEAEVEVKADSSGLRGEVSRAAALAGAGQEIDIELNVEDGGSIGRGTTALNGFIASAGRANISIRFLGSVFRLLKWPLIITGATLAAQALAALGGAAVAVVGSLSALVGSLAVIPGLLSSVFQGAGVVALAFSGVKDALKALGTGDLEKINEAMAKLSPAAQGFARELFSLKPLLEDLKRTAAENLLPGLTTAIRTTLPLFPIFRDAVAQTAKALSDLAVQGAQLIASPAFAGDLKLLTDQNVVSIRQFGTAGILLGDALRHIMVAAIPLVDFFGRLAIRLSENIQLFAATNRENGKMAAFFERTAQVIERVISIGANLFETFFNIGSAGRQLGDDLLASFDKITGGWARFTGSVEGQNQLKEFFDGLRPSLTALGGLITDLAGALGRLLQNPALPAFIESMRTSLLPALEGILGAAEKFGPSISEALAGVTRLLEQLITLPGLPGFISSLGLLAKAIAGMLEHVPGLKTALAVFISISGIAKAAQLVGFAAGLAKTGAAAKLLTGAFLALRIVVTSIAVALGAPIVAVIAIGVAIGALVFLVVKYWDEIKAATIAAWNAVTEFLSTAWEAIKNAAVVVFDFLKAYYFGLWEGIRNTVMSVWNGIRDFLSGLWEGLKNVATTVFNALVQSVVDRFNFARNTVTAIWNGIRDFLSGVWNSIRDTVSNAARNVVDTLGNAWNTAKNAVSNAWNAIRNAVSEAVNSLLSTVRSIPGSITSALGNLASLLFQKGKDIVQGLINGVKSMGRTLVNAILSLIPGPVRSVVSNALGIGSPSKVFAGFGRNLIEGMIQGVGQLQPRLLSELAHMAEDVARTHFSIPDIESGINGSGTATGIHRNGTTMQFGSVQVIVQASNDPERTAQAVVDALQGKSNPMTRRTLVKEFNTQSDKLTGAKD